MMDPVNPNPTDAVDISLQKYISAREKTSRAHMEKGVPDYAFDLDIEMRRKIDAIPFMYKFFEYIMKTHMPKIRQQLNLDCILTGPNQYPEIYEMGEECARRLGIGIPKMYVKYDPYMNASAHAFDDSEPIIVLHTSLIDAMTPGELKMIIGHECGHIHNNHMTYKQAGEIILAVTAGAAKAIVPGLRPFITLFTSGVRVLFQDWSRCAEITCDRAGIINADNALEAIMAQAKIKTGGIEALNGINLDEYVRQIDDSQSTPGRLLEILNTHPASQKRILAGKLFSQCEILYKWRPEWKTPDMVVLPKSLTDKKCREFISVFRSAKKSDKGAKI
ncbi:MAG: M48 family metallopeptidase [Oscillospiraceae bacterium]|nr:M48 family metallopeptidase [Oscillospiraceae bacterium]